MGSRSLGRHCEGVGDACNHVRGRVADVIACRFICPTRRSDITGDQAGGVWKTMANHGIQPGPGTYVLFLVCSSVRWTQVGRLGGLQTQPGYYAYVGSAFGPGGISARVAHHARLSSRRHWHIDYLRQLSRPVSCWYTHDPIQREHEWAASVASLPLAMIPLVGFGCSDCRCCSHLIWFPSLPSCRTFRHRVVTELLDHEKIWENSLV